MTRTTDLQARSPRTRRLFARWVYTVVAAMTLAGLTAACEEDTGELAIVRVSPLSGATAGNQAVQIRGRNFRSDIGYTVYFGSLEATKVNLIDPSTLEVTTPQASEAGNVDIVIAADDGPAFRIAEAFRYEDMSGGVVDRMGEDPERQTDEDSNLAY